jgi:hypothetical protein
MPVYPTLHNFDPRDHLLFDTGYSFALLQGVTRVLKEIAECGDYPVAVREMIEAVEEFQEHRLKVRSELYDNAGAVLDVARRLAALDRIIEAYDASTLPPNIVSETLANALLEGKRATGKGLPEIRFKEKGT